MYLGRVTGRLVASVRYPGLEGVKLQLLEPLGEGGERTGEQLVAACSLNVGPGDLVHYIDGREAALVLPETFVPVDVAITGFVEQLDVNGTAIPQDGPGMTPDSAPDSAPDSGASPGSQAP